MEELSAGRPLHYWNCSLHVVGAVVCCGVLEVQKSPTSRAVQRQSVLHCAAAAAAVCGLLEQLFLGGKTQVDGERKRTI